MRGRPALSDSKELAGRNRVDRSWQKDFAMYNFHVGQKVVCINDTFKHVSIDQGIRKGQIYTIRWVGPYKHYIDGEFIGVKLAEIHRGPDDGPEGYGADDMPYRATRFRPLLKDRLSALKNLLAPTPKGEKPYLPEAPEEPKRNTPVRKKETV
jgi:hypothetical protein